MKAIPLFVMATISSCVTMSHVLLVDHPEKLRMKPSKHGTGGRHDHHPHMFLDHPFSCQLLPSTLCHIRGGEDDVRLGHEWSWADLSVCGEYRWALGRRWLASKPMILWIMLNPSTADHNDNDPTIRRIIDFSQRWGYGALVVCNLYPMRSPVPDNLFMGDRKKNLGPDGTNDYNIMKFTEEAAMIMCAWGAHGQKLGQGERVRRLLINAGYELHALRFTKMGQPCHPLYLPKKLEPVKWEATP